MTWEEISQQACARLDASIPSQWRIPSDKLPPAEQAEIMDFPYKSGLFSEREIAITTSSATDVVKHIAVGEWKAEDVTRAFCKRAAITHQLVRNISNLIPVSANTFVDQLSDCDDV